LPSAYGSDSSDVEGKGASLTASHERLVRSVRTTRRPRARLSALVEDFMLGRLTELMFVEILREYIQRLTDNEGGWLAGVNDAHVGKSVALAARGSTAQLDGRGARAGSRGLALGAGATLHGAGGRSAHAIRAELADAARQADDARGGAQYPGRRDTRRLRLRSRLQPCIQACDRLAAGDLAQRRARRGSSAQRDRSISPS
jgi:hypothetical protein